MDRTALTYIVQVQHNIGAAMLCDSRQSSAAFLREAQQWLDHTIDYLQKPHEHCSSWVGEGGGP